MTSLFSVLSRSTRVTLSAPILPILALVASSTTACTKQESTSSRVSLHVAAAADLEPAFRELGEVARAEGTDVTFTFGSSGLLAKQLAEGAPYDLFASANVGYTVEVAKAGVCEDTSRVRYARGKLVLYCPGGVPRADQGGPSGLSGLATDKVGKIAMANPEQAPYGKAARESIERAGLLSRVEAKLVVASNVGESLQFARSGNADCAFVSRALLLSEPAGSPRTLDVPDELYAPLEQALVVCPGKPKATEKPDDAHAKSVAAARAFAGLVGSEKGRAVLNKYGCLPPGQVPRGAGKRE